MRACCVAVTSLPDASPMCISQFDSHERGDYKAVPIFPKYDSLCSDGFTRGGSSLMSLSFVLQGFLPRLEGAGASVPAHHLR